MPSAQQLYKKLQREVDKITSKKLLGAPATLQRGTTNYTVNCVIGDYTSMERMGRALDPLDSKATISAKGLTISPAQDTDRLITYVPGTQTVDKIYRITSRPRPLAPAGVTVLWELSVREYG